MGELKEEYKEYKEYEEFKEESGARIREPGGCRSGRRRHVWVNSRVTKLMKNH
jgi:hypothetical protein